MKYPMRILIT
nr:unnamed protein product [Callosobruchus chinensis]